MQGGWTNLTSQASTPTTHDADTAEQLNIILLKCSAVNTDIIIFTILPSFNSYSLHRNKQK